MHACSLSTRSPFHERVDPALGVAVMPDRTEFLTVPEVMAYLRLGRTTVYAQARLYLTTGGAEGIPCRRFGRSLRFPSDELARFAHQSREDQPEPRPPAPRPPAQPKRSAKRPRPSSPSQSQSPRTASARTDDTIVQPALPFTD